MGGAVRPVLVHNFHRSLELDIGFGLDLGPIRLETATLRVTLPQKPDPAAIELPDEEYERTRALVETLMGRKPELRFEYIQKNARFARDLDV